MGVRNIIIMSRVIEDPDRWHGCSCARVQHALHGSESTGRSMQLYPGLQLVPTLQRSGFSGAAVLADK